MKFNIAGDVWEKSNIFARACFIIGIWFVNLAMHLAGFEDAKKEEE